MEKYCHKTSHINIKLTGHICAMFWGWHCIALSAHNSWYVSWAHAGDMSYWILKCFVHWNIISFLLIIITFYTSWKINSLYSKVMDRMIYFFEAAATDTIFMKEASQIICISLFLSGYLLFCQLVWKCDDLPNQMSLSVKCNNLQKQGKHAMKSKSLSISD